MSADSDGIRWVPVEDVGEVRMGKQLSPSSREGSGQYPYLRVANVHEGIIDYGDVKSMSFSSAERQMYCLKPGDVLLNEGQESLSMVGRSAIYRGLPNAFCFQNTLIRFRPGACVIPEYAQAVFVDWRRRGVFAGVAEKTSISHLGGRRFARLKFPLVSMSTQRRIIEALDGVGEVERAAETAISKLGIMRRCVSESLVPSRAGDQKTQWLAVGEVGSVRMGKQLSPDGRSAGEKYPYLRVANVLEGRIDYSDVKEMGFTEGERQAYSLAAGDILLNEGQSLELVGRSAICTPHAEKYFYQNTLIRFRCGESLLAAYAQEVFNGWMHSGAFAQVAKKTTSIAHLGGGRFASMLFPLLSLSEQQRVVDVLGAWDERIKNAEAELRKVQDMKHGLAHDLLSGKVALDRAV